MKLQTWCCSLLLCLLCTSTTITATFPIDEIIISANECAPSSGKSTGTTVSMVDSNINLLTFAENKDDNVFNPERGWLVNVHLDVPSERNNLSNYYSSGKRVVLALLHMKDVTQPYARLSTANLAELTTFLDAVRSMGMKAVFRAAYNFNGQPNPEPENMADILAHQEQIGPILRTYKDVIFHVQTGMLGPWGEMHSSRHAGTPSRVADVARKWLDLIPAEMGISLRTPALMKSVIGALNSNSDRIARIGFYNDCFFGSSTDYETYAGVNSRTSDLRWLQNQTRLAMMGGETCPPIAGEEQWSAPSNAISEMIQLHTSYLNREWFPPVYVGSGEYPKVVGWKNRATCDGAENGYDYVSKRLGYRYVLKSGAITSTVPAGGIMQISLRVQNIGFSSIKSARTLEILMSNGATTYQASVKGDPRFWERESGIVKLNWYLRLPQNISPGTWNVDLRIPDSASNLINNPKYNIQFANLGIWQGSTGSNRLYSVTVVPADGNSVAGSTLQEVDPASAPISGNSASTASTISSASTSQASTLYVVLLLRYLMLVHSSTSTTAVVSTGTESTTTSSASSTATSLPSEGPIISVSSAPPSVNPAAPSDTNSIPPTDTLTADFLLAGVVPSVSVVTADAPSPLPNRSTPVWRTLSLSGSPSGADLIFGLASFVPFSLSRKVEIYVFTDANSTPSIILKGNKVFMPATNFPVRTVTNPPSGLEMSITVPLSVFQSRPSSVRIYALNTYTRQRIPADGSFLNLTLPVFAAHVRFMSVAPDVVPSGALIDTGAAASAVADFSFGWSEDNSASSSSCIAFSGRTWTISVPVPSFYRVRARLAAPSASTCVGVSIMNTTLGVACDGSAASTMLASGSLRFSQAPTQATPLPLANTQLCELTVSIATGPVLHHELSVASGVNVDTTTVADALAALTGEASNRFGVLSIDYQSHNVGPARQDTSARVYVTYLIADEWLTASSVPAAVVSATLLSASAAQWTSVSPYTPVSSAVVSPSGPAPVAYVPTDLSSNASPSDSSNAILFGVIAIIVVVAVILAAILTAVVVHELRRVPVWKRESGIPSSSSANVSSPVTSTTALAPNIGATSVEMRPVSSSLVTSV